MPHLVHTPKAEDERERVAQATSSQAWRDGGRGSGRVGAQVQGEDSAPCSVLTGPFCLLISTNTIQTPLTPTS